METEGCRSEEWHGDLCSFGFLGDVLRGVVGLAVIVPAAVAAIHLQATAGAAAGSVAAVALYLSAWQGGRTFARTGKVGPTMAWLLGAQVVIWTLIGVAIAGVKVDAVGFAWGASALPLGVIGATCFRLIWPRRVGAC